MKFVFGLFFIVGVPLVCMLVFQIAKKSNTPTRGPGLALLILGSFVVSLTLLAYIPMIIVSFTDTRISKTDEIFGLFVWLIPGISFLLTGMRMRKSDHGDRETESK